MKLEFWGVRGTAPVSGKDKVRYGGNTSCASLTASGGEVIIVDAGTGIRKLGLRLAGRNQGTGFRIHLLLTHFHLDHIIGLPFFPQLYMPGAVITLYSPRPPRETERRLSGLMGGLFFPVGLRETRSQKAFRQVPPEEFFIGDVAISFCPLRHPQGNVAYKLRQGRKAVVFAIDTEHPERGVDEKLAAFSREASSLIYDATFTPEEYRKGRRGWGHSTWRDGAELALAAGVKTLLLSHWSPERTDRQVDSIIDRARKVFPRTAGAREGLHKVF